MSDRSREHGARTLPPGFTREEGPTGRRSTFPTLVDDAALEDARQQSARSSLTPPPEARRAGAEAADTDVEVEVLDIEDAGRPVLSEAALRHAIGPLGQVPRLRASEAEVLAQAGGPTVAFVVGFLDGATPLRHLLDATGLPAIETLAVVHELLERGLLELDPA